ncbi:hypothetical protein BGZ99_001192 [Dissophora globulifera]|uniref:Uncharacterized protein n=1 Tax=Dissophora globulifera TaxID=979702 RepID=A0A9P6RP06_9FUNG|nr:hypothetical protein BGZ99_001192 [Dissophora globulifera]
MTTERATAWSGLFHGLPNTTPASRLYTEEAIQNEQLTADQVIGKAQSSANLLVEMVAALREDQETLDSLEANDIIQTLRQECQGMSDYLAERIWEDSGDTSSYYQTYDSSSSRPQHKTADEEAQIAVFIACNEQIQSAIRRYDEFKDVLYVKKIQEEETARDRAYNSLFSSRNLNDDEEEELDDLYSASTDSCSRNFIQTSSIGMRDNHRHIDSSSTYAAAAVALGDIGDDEDEYGVDSGSSSSNSRVHHLRKSKQPLVWKLDPREDFKATQSKIKKDRTIEERRQIQLERMVEKSPRNGVHGLTPDPLELTPDMLSPDDDKKAEEEAPEPEETTTKPEETTTKPEEPTAVEQADQKEEEETSSSGNTDIANIAAVDHVKDQEENEDAGVLSDDSWEEIPEQGIVNMSIEDSLADVTSTVSSSTSSFLITPSEATSRTPTPPSAAIRDL